MIDIIINKSIIKVQDYNNIYYIYSTADNILDKCYIYLLDQNQKLHKIGKIKCTNINNQVFCNIYYIQTGRDAIICAIISYFKTQCYIALLFNDLPMDIISKYQFNYFRYKDTMYYCLNFK